MNKDDYEFVERCRREILDEDVPHHEDEPQEDHLSFEDYLIDEDELSSENFLIDEDEPDNETPKDASK